MKVVPLVCLSVRTTAFVPHSPSPHCSPGHRVKYNTMAYRSVRTTHQSHIEFSSASQAQVQLWPPVPTLKSNRDLLTQLKNHHTTTDQDSNTERKLVIMIDDYNTCLKVALLSSHVVWAVKRVVPGMISRTTQHTVSQILTCSHNTMGSDTRCARLDPSNHTASIPLILTCPHTT